jgi:hypothetical protein
VAGGRRHRERRPLALIGSAENVPGGESDERKDGEREIGRRPHIQERPPSDNERRERRNAEGRARELQEGLSELLGESGRRRRKEHPRPEGNEERHQDGVADVEGGDGGIEGKILARQVEA